MKDGKTDDGKYHRGFKRNWGKSKSTVLLVSYRRKEREHKKRDEKLAELI